MTSVAANKKNLGIFICFYRIQYYTEDTSKSKLIKNLKTCDAINYYLHCIGILINKLPKEVRAKYKEFSWVWLELFKDDFYWSGEDICSTVYDETNISANFDHIAEVFRRECPQDAPKFFKHVEDRDE